MSKVLITKSKLDDLAGAVSAKSGVALPLTIAQMQTAVENISGVDTSHDTVDAQHLLDGYTAHDATGTAIVGEYVPSAPSLQSKTKTYTPTTSQQTETVTPDSSHTGLSSVAITVNAIQTETASATPSETAQTIEPSSGKYLSSVSVGAISSSYVGSGITRRDSTDLSASGATVTVPSGYYSAQASKSVSSGSATAPATISGSSATVSTGTNTLTLSKTVSVTPSVSAGYVSSGTAGNSAVSLTASVTTQGATTYHPSTTDQSISSGTYLTGAQTINAVTTTNLTADNIKDGVVVQVGDSSDSDCVASVTGTYTGGGGSNWTLMGSKELTVSTTGTSNTNQGDITCSGAYDDADFIWVRIRDKAGKRAGYMYGTDTVFINANKKNGSTSTYSTKMTTVIRYSTSSQWACYIGNYGLYAYSISNAGKILIYSRYNSTNTLTINGTYTIEVYKLTPPTNKTIFG